MLEEHFVQTFVGNCVGSFGAVLVERLIGWFDCVFGGVFGALFARVLCALLSMHPCIHASTHPSIPGSIHPSIHSYQLLLLSLSRT